MVLKTESNSRNNEALRPSPDKTKALTVSRDELVKEMEERRWAEEKAKRLDSFPQLNPSPILEIDDGGAITFYNQAAVKVLEKIGPEAKLADLLPADLGEIAAAARQDKEKVFYREVRVKDTVFGQNIYFVEPYDVLRIYNIDITECKQAEEALKRQHAILSGINRIFQEALTCETEEQLGETCLAVAEELTGSKFGFIDKLNQEGRLDSIAISDLGWEACKIPDTEKLVLPKSLHIRGIYGPCLREGQSEIINDPPHHPDSIGVPTGHPPITAFLGVPLKSAGKTIGLIGLGNKEGGYKDEDQEAVEALAPAAVEAFMRKRAEACLKADFLAMSWLHEISMNLIQQDSLPSLLEKFLDAAIGITGADMGNIQLCDPPSGALRILAHVGFEPPFLDFFDRVHDGWGSCGTSMMQREHVVVEDVTQSPIFVGTPALEVVLAAGVRAVQSTPIISATGNLLGIISTHWKKIHRPEERVLRLMDVLGRQAAELIERTRAEEALKERTAQLERSNRDLEDFAYVSSHDLQEPLRQMANFSEILAREYGKRLDERGVRYAGYITAGAKRLLDLINDLLSYSLVGQAEIPPVPPSLEDILEGTLKDLHPLILESGAEISHDPLPALRVNPNQMAQLLRNLITNALKFHNEQPTRIHLSARQEGGEWVISIRDNGIGFDQKYAEQIFQVFRRMHSKEKYPGTGIGLAICKKIVERHGGRIWAESRPGQGAIFYFTIPA